MASYKIVWRNSARKELKKLDRQAIPRIIQVVEQLAVDPCPDGYKKLKGSDHSYRVRIGDYRVISSVQDEVLTIEVIKVGHRKNIYR